MKVPNRWYNYKNSGRIHGTNFVAFKVPLREGYCRNMVADKSFTPAELLRSYPNIKLVIDLTFTTKYYNGDVEFRKKGVQYKKILCKGRELPLNHKYQEFASIVDDFLSSAPRDTLIGVHCTHGVNRTGYFIVRYMIERFGYSSTNALRIFCRSRGYAIERTNYIADLHERGKLEGWNDPKCRKTRKY